MKIICIGGHVTPALAVIEKLSTDNEVLFIGRKYSLEGDKGLSLEYKVIKKRGIQFIPIIAGRIQRRVTIHTFSSFLKLPIGFLQSLFLLWKYKPDVVVGFGGYLSVPVGIAAYVLRIPLIIHEQTLDAGLANKFLSRFATKVCLAWQQSAKYFSEEKVAITGNPIRKLQVTTRLPARQGYKLQVTSENIPLIYITGGGTGAHPINLLLEGCLEHLLQKFRIIHQTGDAREFGDYERLVGFKHMLPERLGERYYVTKFIDPDDVGSIFEQADLVVSRSGINTVTELLYFGKPCLLIPLPHGQRNEQFKNAQFVKKVGIGDYLIQDNIDSQKLFIHVETMIEQRGKYLAFAKQAKTLVHNNAAENIKNIIYAVVKKE